MIDHRSYTHNLSAVKLKPEKGNSGLNGIRTYDLFDNGAVLYQLSNQLGACHVVSRNIPVDGEDTSEYMKNHILSCKVQIYDLSNIHL